MMRILLSIPSSVTAFLSSFGAILVPDILFQYRVMCTHTITSINSVYQSEIKLYEIRPHYNCVCVTDFAVCVKDWFETIVLCNVLPMMFNELFIGLKKTGSSWYNMISFKTL